jgi:hypothetical protein
MLRKIFLRAIVTIIWLHTVPAQTNDEQTVVIKEFDNANIRFEQNVTDNDVEIVFEIKSNDKGLNSLSVVSPDGRTVFHFTAPDDTTLGIRQFHLESPEPRDVEGVKKAYPEGVYKFTGLDAEGTKYYGEDVLDHKLPEAVSILKPGPEVLEQGINNLEITWSHVPEIHSYVLEIDQDELEIKITAELPSTVTKFILPEGVLKPGFKYSLSIGTIAKNNNRSFIETTLTTAVGE